jgi:pimeloyl-ACP methyl ester carboxylesterase
MLRLMTLDRAASVYVARPCYFGLEHSAGCSPIFWTVGRFNVDVVESMAAVIEHEAATSGADGIVLLGHSGGGALAVLLASRIQGVRAVVTVAGNLDTDAWTELHGYAPLSLSLNPSAAPLAKTLLVLHLVGADDDVTPPAFVTASAGKLGSGEVRVLPNVAHTCCWDAVWPSVLDGLP